ncbi:protein Shroom2 [Nilaparvata lugens]|uniref:protein Shroom2 n=1 Tax=Nilaparvata lugens TaxID=108931 RepID=UPI00193D9DDB|nr:protein Shroom2 [Nilaparvata lugens]
MFGFQRVYSKCRVSSLFNIECNCESSSETSGKVKEQSGGESVAESAQNLSANSAYFTTSECKARLLALCNNQPHSTIGPNDNLYQKKEELMCRLSRKLAVLREEAVAVVEETALNETLGDAVAARTAAAGARPHELAKLRLHIREVGHITQLLLGLSGRLARAENALLGMEDNHCERKILEEKRDKLRAQLEEAKQLKVSIDRRSGSVSTMLYKYLSADEYADYDHFIGMKAKLLIDSREIDDKIKLGEEQLAALKEMLNETTTAR